LYLHFLRVTSKNGVATIRDRRTGIEHRLGVLTANPAPLPSPYHYELARRVLHVQELTKQPIFVPRREFFTSDDVENLVHVEEIVAEGRQKAESMNFELVPKNADDEEWRRRLNDVVTNVSVRAERTQRLVLDTYVSLGPAEIKCTEGRMTVDNVDDAVSAAGRGESIAIKVVPTKKGRIVASYPWWNARSRR
jgi:hypothetical protein